MQNGVEFGFDVSGNSVFFGIIIICNLLTFVKSYTFYTLYILTVFIGVAIYISFAFVTHTDIWFSSFNIFY